MSNDSPASVTDYQWMALALRLAEQGQYTTSPNPRVGCVIVSADNQELGRGAHLLAGQAHAEVVALRQAKGKTDGATAYVTLEPCSHFGRTPPCADALVNAGIKRVVVAMQDPNPQVSGNGIQRLRDAGIAVTVGLLQQQAETLNRGFVKRMRSGRPWVTVKLASTLDGKIALANGQSQWITGPAARRDVQRYRAKSCAVLTGSGTVVKDNPSLLVRPEQAQLTDYPSLPLRQPHRIVVTSKTQLDTRFAIFHDGQATTVVTPDPGLYPTQIDTWQAPMKAGHVDLSILTEQLGHYGFNEVWVEAGPTLAGSFLAQGLVDELIVYQSPKIIGDAGQSMIKMATLTQMQDVMQLSLLDIVQLGDDVRLRYQPNSSHH